MNNNVLGHLAVLACFWLTLTLVSINQLVPTSVYAGSITDGVFKRGLKGMADVTYSGSVFASFQVDSLLGCGIFTLSNQKNIFRLTDGVLCEVLNDTLADPLKVTYSPTPLPSGSPILYSDVNTKFADSYHTVTVPDWETRTCNLTRPPDTPSPIFGMIVGVRANKTGRPRTMYDFKCRDVYEDYMQVDVDPNNMFWYHTEDQEGGCLPHHVVLGIYDFYDIGVQHILMCHPVLPPATVSDTDCYNIDLLNSTVMEDPGLALSVLQPWPAECTGNGTDGDYVMTSMKNAYYQDSVQYEVDRMTCCRLSVG